MSVQSGAQSIKVLLVGLSGYPSYPNKDLPGAQGDLLLWLEQLHGLGVGLEQIWLATSDPSTPNVNSRALAPLVKALPEGHTNTTGDVASIVKLVEAFTAALAPTDRIMVVWAGHGYTDPEGTLFLATAQTTPACLPEDMLPWAALCALLDQRPLTTEMTVVLDTCFAAAGPDQRSLTTARSHKRTWLERVRRTDVILCAALGGQQARELKMHRGPVGAFSWAITAVLARWGYSTDRVGWDISAEELIARTGSLLFSLNILQTPCADGPAEALTQPILHRPGDEPLAPTSEAQRLPVSELDPGTSGLVYSLIDPASGAALTTKIVATATSVFSGVQPGRVWWSNLPSGSFKLNSASTSPITTSGGTTYASAPFSGYVPGPGTVSSCWKISGNSFSGYMYMSGSSMIFLRSSSGGTIGQGSVFTHYTSYNISTSLYFNRATDTLKPNGT